MIRMCTLIGSGQQKNPIAEGNSAAVELVYMPFPQSSRLTLLEERE